MSLCHGLQNPVLSVLLFAEPLIVCNTIAEPRYIPHVGTPPQLHHKPVSDLWLSPLHSPNRNMPPVPHPHASRPVLNTGFWALLTKQPASAPCPTQWAPQPASWGLTSLQGPGSMRRLWTRNASRPAEEPGLAGRGGNYTEREEPSGKIKGFCVFI